MEQQGIPMSIAIIFSAALIAATFGIAMIVSAVIAAGA